MLAKAILVHGVIGYKFCWLLPSEDNNQGIPAGHESNGAVAGDHWEDMNQLIHQLGTNHLIIIIDIKIQNFSIIKKLNMNYILSTSNVL